MRLQQLKYILEVVEKGSISEAARALFISQPSLTAAIKELEEEFDIKIFIRSNKGVIVSNDGEEFLGYARQILEQVDLIEERYKKGENRKILFSVSSQHYSFAINAFVELIKEFGQKFYDFTLKETQTFEIIHDVDVLKSEVGVLYLCSNNEEAIKKLTKNANINIEEICKFKPHVFLNASHPLAGKKQLKLEELDDFPYLSYEQGKNSSMYLAEEVLSYIPRPKNINVSDRATLFNLLVGLNGYTISTGVASKELNGESIVSIPLKTNEYIKICVLTKNNMILSKFAVSYIEKLKSILK